MQSGTSPHVRPSPALLLSRPTRAGSQIGPYTVLRAIGRGATSVVYEAQHRVLGKRVALKVLHPASDASGSEEQQHRATARFVREGRAVASVQHPHIIDVFDSGIDGGAMYLAMELVEGDTLAGRIRQGSSTSLEAWVGIFLPIVSAVAELHAAGILHRDLKPANILMDRARGNAASEVVPKVADFGLSRLDDGQAHLTESGALLGTIAYMAPEQLRGRPASEASDQYALGVIAYECLTGSLPFLGSTPYEQMQAATTSRAKPPSHLRRDLPRALDAVLLRALDPEPTSRFPSIDELGAALLPFADAVVRERWRPELAPSTVAAPAPAPRRPRRGVAVALVAALAILAFALTAFRWLESPPRPDIASSVAPSAAVSTAVTPAATPPEPAPQLQASDSSASTATSEGEASALPAPSPAPVPDATSRRTPPRRPAQKAPVKDLGANSAPIVDPD